MTQGNQQNPHNRNREEQKRYQQRPGQQDLGRQNPQNPAKQSTDKDTSAKHERAAVDGSKEQYASKKNVEDENRQSHNVSKPERDR